MIDILVTTSGGQVSLPSSAILSISSWSIDLQDNGRCTSPTATLELSALIVDKIPELIIKGTPIRIDGWNFIIDSIVTFKDVLTVNLTSAFSDTIKTKSYAGTWPSESVSSATLRLFNHNFSGFNSNRISSAVNLNSGELDVIDDGGWKNWTFKFSDLGEDVVFLITYEHSFQALAQSLIGSGDFFYSACTDLKVKWTFNMGLTPYSSDYQSLNPDKENEIDIIHMQRAECRGIDLYNAMYSVRPTTLDLLFDELKKPKKEFTATIIRETKLGDKTVSSHYYHVSASCSDDQPLWDQSKDIKPIPGIVANTLTGTVHNIDENFTITAEDLLSWYEAHGLNIVETNGQLKLIKPNEISTTDFVDLTADEIISYDRCSTEYSAIKSVPGVKITFMGKGNDDSDLTETIEFGTVTDDTKTITTELFGNLFDCQPCVFLNGTGPINVSGNYLYCKSGRNLYDTSMTDHTMYFGNHAGIFKGQLKELLPKSGNQAHAKDKNNARYITCTYTVIILDPSENPTNVEKIAKAGPIAVLQDLPDYYSSTGTVITSDAWELKVPWEIGHNLALGDTVRVKLRELDNKNAYCKVGGLTFDWSSNEVSIRIVPFIRSTTPVEPSYTKFNNEIRKLFDELPTPTPTPIITGTEIAWDSTSIYRGCTELMSGGNAVSIDPTLIDQTKSLVVKVNGQIYQSNQYVSETVPNILSPANGFANSTQTGYTARANNIWTGGVFIVQSSNTKCYVYIDDALAANIPSDLQIFYNAEVTYD